MYQDVISESKEQYQDVISSLTPQHHNAASDFKEQHQDVISNCPLEDPRLTTNSSEHHQDIISEQTLEAVEFSGTQVDFDAKKKKQMYIGETSRPVRSRIQEHMKKAEKVSPDSFIVQH